MTGLAHVPVQRRQHAQLPQAAPRHAEVLEAYRRAALQCRTAPRSDLFEACALLSVNPDMGRDAFATALIKGLQSALPKAPVLLRPGEPAQSFDEAWLLAALAACADEDWDSLAFLMRSRLGRAHQRNIAFLIRGSLGPFD